MKIGNVEIKGWAGLAPMAGVADRAFREVCKGFGAGYLVGEMASAKGLCLSGKKTEDLLATTDAERPVAVQLFGDDPATMAQAAQLAIKFSPDIIDINMGCPAPKIAGNGGGSALMKNPQLAGEIIKAVSTAVNIPVTVKFRKGWDDSLVNAVEFAKMAEANGAAAICIHGRTRAQMYAPPVDIDIIRRVKQAVSVPVMANGDVASGITAKEMYEKTGADYIMVGRGALGAPWVFSQINAYLERGEILPEPTIEQKAEIMTDHLKRMCEYKGEALALREGRKHAAWYMKGLKGAAELRRLSGRLTTLNDLYRLAEAMVELNRE